MPARFKVKSQVPMEKNFPAGNDRKPPPNFVVVPASLIQKHERRGMVNVCENEIDTTNATDSGISNFSNVTDHTGQGGEGCTAVTRHDLNVIGNKVNAKGGKGSGITNFGDTLGKNSNDEDDAAAGGLGDQGHNRAPRSSAPASTLYRSPLLVPMALAFLVLAVGLLLWHFRLGFYFVQFEPRQWSSI